MPKQYNEEIAKLKRNQYWTNRELKEVKALLKFKGEQITQQLNLISEAKLEERYDDLKTLDQGRIWLLREQDALINLQCKLNAEQGETGKQIVKIRQGTPDIIKDTVTLGKLNNIHWTCSKLVKLRKEQRLIKVGLSQWRRMREQVLAKKPIINYRNTGYRLDILPWTIEQIERRIKAYEEDQKLKGETIIRIRDIIAKDPLQKQTYQQVIKNIKLAQSSKI